MSAKAKESHLNRLIQPLLEKGSRAAPEDVEALRAALDTVTAEELERSANLLALAGIGHEFFWGENPPSKISEARASVVAGPHSGKAMTRLQLLWHNVITTDTDMF